MLENRPIDGADRPVSETEGWDYVGAVLAHADSVHAIDVPTLADSNGAGLHLTTFLVRAVTTSPATFLDSPPDTGYSVDNLPPAVPHPFTAAYVSGATHLHWGANAEADLGHYQVHRGGTPDFVPGAASLIATLPDTEYVDPGAAGSCYRVSAVDVNGNEGGYAALGPEGTVSVPKAEPPSFALEAVDARGRPTPVASPTGFERATPRRRRPQTVGQTGKHKDLRRRRGGRNRRKSGMGGGRSGTVEGQRSVEIGPSIPSRPPLEPHGTTDNFRVAVWPPASSRWKYIPGRVPSGWMGTVCSPGQEATNASGGEVVACLVNTGTGPTSRPLLKGLQLC